MPAIGGWLWGHHGAIYSRGWQADPWNTVADWAIGGGPAGRDPTGDDVVTLAGSGATITGDGIANQLVVQAAYQLTGTITLAASSTAVAPALTVDNGGLLTIAGAINDAPGVGEGGVAVGNGRLAVFGPNADQPASLTSNGLVIGDPGYDGSSEVDVTLGTLAIAHKTTAASGDIAVGAHGSGVLIIRYLGTVTANTVEVQSGTATGGDNVLSIGPSGTLAVAGALTIGDNATTIAGGGGTLIDDGALAAGSIEIASDGAGVLKGEVFTNALTVDAGGIITGAAAFYGIGSTPDDFSNPPVYKPIAIVDNGTIEGAVGVAPMTLAGGVSGTGTLLIDAGGGIEVSGAVAPTITVRFAPGVSPFNIGSDGSAGGVLDLRGLGGTYDLAGFGATIFGFASGDQIDVDADLRVTSATLGAGNVLTLRNAANAAVGTLKLDPAANFASDSFVVQPAPYPNGLFALEGFAYDNPPTEIAIVPKASSGTLAPPVLTLPSPLRASAGTATLIPPISIADVTGYNAGESFTVTLRALVGTFVSVIGLSDFFSGSTVSLSPGTDGTQTLGDPQGSNPMTADITVSGTGTSQISITSTDIFLVDAQLALIQYIPDASSGNDMISVDATASGTGTTQIGTGTIGVTIGQPGTAFTWTGAAGNGFDTAGSFSGAASGPPGSGDTVLFGTEKSGALSYAVTGAGSAGAITVTANALFQGAVETNGGPTTTPQLIAEIGGIAGFAGLALIHGDAAAGYANTGGTIDFFGLLHLIYGNLLDGDGGVGNVQIDGQTQVAGDTRVGYTASGTLELGNGGLGLGLAKLITTNLDIGVIAGVAGVVTVGNSALDVSGTLTVGDAGQGALVIGDDATSTIANSLNRIVIGNQASGVGQVTLKTNSSVSDYLRVQGTITVGNAGNGALTLLDGAVLGTPELDVGALAGGVGLVDSGTAYVVANLAVGGTATASGGTGTFIGMSLATNTVVWGKGLFQGELSSDTTAIYGRYDLRGAGGSGGNLTIKAGGVVDGSGGSIAGLTAFENDGLVLATGGSLDLDGDIIGTGTIEIANNATVTTGFSGKTVQGPNGNPYQAQSTIGGSQTVTFDGAGSIQAQFLPPVSGPAVRVTGFNTADAIVFNRYLDIPTLTYKSVDPARLTYMADSGDADSTLRVYNTDGTLQDAIRFAGLPNAQFKLTVDGSGNGTLTLQCFAAGTRIATPHGPVAVEALRPGDDVLTVSGDARPIHWAGQRRVDCLRHPDPRSVRPIRVNAHSFGDAMPARDLLLSPDHAVFAEGVLIPIKYLVNGTTVWQVQTDTITYHHIELDSHDVVLAEGLPCESYLDTGNRTSFGSEPVTRLHPEFGRTDFAWESRGYAPLAVAGETVDRVRATLEARALTSQNRATSANSVALYTLAKQCPTSLKSWPTRRW